MEKQVPSKEQLQATFDKVARHLLRQGRKAESEGYQNLFTCRYRARDNTKCAVGCLIPDEVYTEEMEDRDVFSLLSNFPELRNIKEIDHCDELLVDLQRIHDYCPVEEWPRMLLEAGTRFELNLGVLSTKAGV